MLVQVKYGEQQKYVKLDSTEGQFDFLQFHLKVIERFCLPPDAKVIYKDATGTEVDAEIFSDLIGQGNVVLKVFTNDEFSDSFSSELSDSSSGSKTLTDSTRRQMINILVAHMIENHGQLPTKVIREQYALGIVMLFPSLRDPYSKKGYEHFYDAASNTGYIAWRLKTVHRKIRRGSVPPDSPLDGLPGGPKCQRPTNLEGQLDGDACREAMSLLNHTTDKSKLVKDPGSSVHILSTFPRFLDTKGLVEQDFTLLFDEETSSRLLQKWDTFFRPNVIKEAKRLTSTAELSQLLLSAERPQGSDLDETRSNALVSFYTFLQTALYNIDVGKMKESPRVKDLRARLLNQTVTLS
ncbi:DNA mismatch repair protein MutL [Labeo rohita]|uniref:DNA mismatch repair protein MutL n=1 Tax=Labeo rohita TaxID=84645 RepID=A0ABQ8M1R5_LABRO|nr:DNA mismatch repair protein MutL [Labeo rohita]